MELTRDLVRTKAKQTFPQQDPADILEVLDRYGVDPDEAEGRERVHLAILKLSEGKIDKLYHYVGVAKSDFRDVLAWAEYPNQACLSTIGPDRSNPEAYKAIVEKDLQQYLAWLQGNEGPSSTEI